MRSSRSLSAAALIAACAGSSFEAVANGAEVGRAGARGRVLEPLLLSDEVYTESYVVVADFEDGTYVLNQLGISNAGPGDAHGGCRILISEKGVPKNFSVSSIVEREGWRYDASKEPSLMVDKCRWTAGASNFQVSASIGGATFELSLEGNAGALREPVSEVRDGDDFYDLEVLIPWGRATATIARPGAPVKKLSGFGSVDHSRSTALPGKSAKRWVRFRGLGAKSSKLILVRIPPKGAEHDGWYWAEGGKGRAPISRILATPSGKPGPDTQWKVMLDGDGGPWKITTGPLIYRDAPLEDHGFVGSMLGAVVGNPVTYVFRATLASKQERKEFPGVFEITLSD